MNKGQQFIRRVNDSIYDVLVKLGSEDGEFGCECEEMHCERRIMLTLREYAARRNSERPLLSRLHVSATEAPLR